MSTHDMNIANQGFPAFRSDLNNALAALVSNSSSATEPTTTVAYQFWADTTNDLLKQRNAANDGWVDLLVLSTGAPVNVTNDAISEGNSSLEVVDTGTGYVKIIIDGVDIGRMKSSLSSLSIGSGDTGLIFYDDATQERVLPWNLSTGNVKDGLVNLGQGNSRFKDLYLSGGVYLGGTGAANHLDDYEEGTWTPVIEGQTTAGSGTYGQQLGRYTKIGHRVFVDAYIDWSAHTGTGNMQIGGLPFTVGPIGTGLYSSNVSDGNITLSANYIISSRPTQSTSKLSLFQLPVGGGNGLLIPMDTSSYIVLSASFLID